MGEVLPGLYLGGYAAVDDATALRAAGITHLLSLREDRVEGAGEIESLHLPMSDAGESSLEQLVHGAGTFIDSALRLGGRVLVYCDLGVNRTPALIAAYLIMKGWTLEDALGQVSRSRPVVGIVEPYMTQLRALAVEGP
jgi:protein-tyrosine phosphatase